MAAALLLLLSLEQVVMLFPFSIRQHISRHFTIGRVSSSFLYLHFLLFSFFGLSVFSSCFQDSYCCCCCLRLLPFILIPPSLRLVRSLHLSRARSDWIYPSVNSRALPCPSVPCLFFSLWFIIDTPVRDGLAMIGSIGFDLDCLLPRTYRAHRNLPAHSTHPPERTNERTKNG